MSETKCSLCGSEWGDVWEIIWDENHFFCCEICKKQYIALIEKIENEIGLDNFDIIRIEGKFDRVCYVLSNEDEFRFRIRFNSEGEINHFKRIWHYI